MTRRLAAAAVVAAVLIMGGVNLDAHHSHAMFDMTREVSITGTVTAYAYRNPHVFLYVDVKADDGTVQNWAVEMSNISNMTPCVRSSPFREDWTPSIGAIMAPSFEPVRVTCHPVGYPNR